MSARLFRKILLIASCAFTATIHAIPLHLDFVRTDSLNGFNGVSVDQATGQYYQRRGFDGETRFDVYDSYADFAASNASHTLNFTTPTYRGTYASVRDGTLYGRSGRMTDDYSSWDLTSLTESNTSNLATFNPQNGAGTFNWGGYSGLNTTDNGHTTIVAGRSATSTDWQVASLDQNLNASVIGNVTPGLNQFGQQTFGYMFLIGQSLFFGDSYNSNHVSTRFDLKSGIQSAVDFDFTGVLGNSYWSNAVYDGIADRLLLWNTSDRTFYSLAGAAAALGAEPITVPEPDLLSLLLLGTTALWISRRRATRVRQQSLAS